MEGQKLRLNDRCVASWVCVTVLTKHECDNQIILEAPALNGILSGDQGARASAQPRNARRCRAFLPSKVKLLCGGKQERLLPCAEITEKARRRFAPRTASKKAGTFPRVREKRKYSKARDHALSAILSTARASVCARVIRVSISMYSSTVCAPPPTGPVPQMVGTPRLHGIPASEQPPENSSPK